MKGHAYRKHRVAGTANGGIAMRLSLGCRSILSCCGWGVGIGDVRRSQSKNANFGNDAVFCGELDGSVIDTFQHTKHAC